MRNTFAASAVATIFAPVAACVAVILISVTVLAGWAFNIEEWYVPEGRQKYEVPVGSSPVAGAEADSAAPAAGR